MLDTRRTMRRALIIRPTLEALQARGDMSALDTLMDMDSAISRAVLTPRQQYVYQLRYVDGYSQREISTLLEITQQRVSKILIAVETEIARAYSDKEVAV